MPAEQQPSLRLEIGHVLCMDLVGYSRLLIDRQSELQKRLNEIVRGTRQFQIADGQGKLICLPTGDGMVLVFFNQPDAPVECAIEISAALKNHPDIQLRMGIHSGPVNEVLDVNERANVAGAGIDLTQRVMDCGDAGHILLSKRVADDLASYDRWQPYLHDLGECEVKHGRKISLTNFYTGEVGNPETPRVLRPNVAQPLAATSRAASSRFRLATGAIVLVALLGAGWWFLSHRAMVSVSLPPAANTAASTAAPKTQPQVPESPEKSIAVLPLENLSDDKQDAYFADGIQDDILTSLAKIADLKVISRTSVMQYRGAARDLPGIGRALGAANIVEGSVRRDGNRVLVNIQLIDAAHDRHLWAERYDRALADSIGLQGELAAEIASALKAKLAPEEKTRLSTKPTDNPQAYLLYLQANELVHVAASKQEAVNADKLYAQAIALDPRFALAYARGSMLNSLMYFIGRDPTRKTKARAWADEGFRFGPDLGEAHMALGLYFYRIDKDYDKALKELAIAAAASPNDSEILDSCGYIYRRQGRWRDALAAFQRARDLDPQRARIDGVPDTLLTLRQWKPATDALEHALQLEPQQTNGWISLAYVQFAQSGNPMTATTTLERLPEPTKNKPAVAYAQWDYAMMARDFAAAGKILPLLPTDEFPNSELPGYYEACIALLLGDRARAHDLLEQIRPAYESAVGAHSEDPKFHSALGNVYALLGRKEDAIKEARHAVELAPESTDAMAVGYAANLAFVYAQCGEVDQAITLLARLLTTPGAARITLAHLRLSWEWDPLRNDPRFQKILQSPEPATIYH
jgi:TolB-like protein/Flp pilus assembly protein TadD